jgi:hypothetical protein
MTVASSHALSLIPGGAVCVVDLSDIDNKGDNQYGQSYHIGNKQYS